MSFPLRPLTRWLLPPPACLLCACLLYTSPSPRD
ncbi:ComF family protein, partial [Pseudomonas aeruginosa]|nr:ComF family protein [Pseudomonas aeruginosa]